MTAVLIIALGLSQNSRVIDVTLMPNMATCERVRELLLATKPYDPEAWLLTGIDPEGVICLQL